MDPEVAGKFQEGSDQRSMPTEQIRGGPEATHTRAGQGRDMALSCGESLFWGGMPFWGGSTCHLTCAVGKPIFVCRWFHHFGHGPFRFSLFLTGSSTQQVGRFEFLCVKRDGELSFGQFHFWRSYIIFPSPSLPTKLPEDRPWHMVDAEALSARPRSFLRLCRVVRILRAARVLISIPEFYLLITGLGEGLTRSKQLQPNPSSTNLRSFLRVPLRCPS